jgi:hypothetical protein
MLNLEEDKDEASNLVQYVVRYVFLYAIIGPGL